MGQPVVHWEIAGKDAAKLQEFYSGIFDWKVNVDEALNYGIVETRGQGGIDGGIFAPPNGAPLHHVLCPCRRHPAVSRQDRITRRKNDDAAKGNSRRRFCGRFQRPRW